ncbi:MAG: alanine/glycine:cation symporter family protein [Bacteroidales bacterium]|uniref:alanine/glycine:cation symporter family protein n=1 Tax=Candidatus Cryptobacteroides sp. TaxID=2952915 RepID=UPI002A74DB63|nr:alanine/glycine:cation symporter family protein [Candidatus Cryptobacteroides sp.]MDD7135926.1 alanine/glycine:cation symporter family protein [Bacteroidales bacterium]MDD7235093.1 alanine/glycine:cation symporter family protein [Bacteroidales bacterium]MDY2701161.1 alanine/glycine:cation symporter family protein [Candidatus Cryptobacteroides sp.]MDY5565700.1 alanine/glycine:cation symporter family protein [Candidatus Cryptobacteroides sp.]
MSDIIATVSDFVCGYPLFILLIGGGLFLFIYSGFVPLRKFGASIKALGHKSDGEGQISSLQALMTTISSTVGMGNIAGVAIAICMGGPGAIFWMWVSALLGMATKFFEGTLAIMYRGRDENGNVKGGPMYMMTEGVSPKLRPLAVFFAFFGMIGCFCVMQANQLTESITTVLTEPMGIATTLPVKLIIGVVMASLVAVVVVGGIDRISKLATKIVPFMVSVYFLLVLIVIVLYIDRLPGVFSQIVSSAFDFKAGFGAVAGIAIIGARRAMYVNEAGVGTASLMHGASKNSDPVREGLVAMLGPAIDSGLVCTLTAIPIIMAGNYEVEGVKGLAIALNSYEALLPGWGKYMLMVVVTFFAFSTMFSYSIYGIKCASYLFGDKNGQMYKYLYLAVILLSCVASLSTVVSIMDFAFAMMAFATMSTILYLSPRVKALLRTRQ